MNSKLIKSIIIFIICFMLWGDIDVYASEIEKQNDEDVLNISSEVAKEIAIRHIQSVLLLSEGEHFGSWHWEYI